MQQYVAYTSAKNVPLVLNFSTNWCETCLDASPIIRRLLEELNGRLDYAEVKADEPDLADELVRWGVTGFPTLVAVRREFMEDSMIIKAPIDVVQIRKFLQNIADLGARDRGESPRTSEMP
ncbi:hypothetical protein PYCC9005_004235 [Savitreella phatthalungensis]